jgi:hypothetical protein
LDTDIKQERFAMPAFSKFANEDPTDVDAPAAKAAYALMTERERLPGFVKVSCIALLL